jgi:hypothetical protein
MTNLKSLVLGSLPLDHTTQVLKAKSSQVFVRDEVSITPSLDPYKDVSRAKEIVLAGKSLAFESGAFGPCISFSQSK